MIPAIGPASDGEIIWVLASPDIARLFCDTGGWSNDDYTAWLEDSLVRILLPDVTPAQQAQTVRGTLA